MDQNFYTLYQEMYEKFSALRITDPPFVSPISRLLTPEQTRNMISQTKFAIENAERDLSVELRPDAKYFLLLNFTEMVLLPISAVRKRPHASLDLISEETLQQNLNDDVRLILSEAARKRMQQSESEAEGITGHNIIDAISEAWDKIKFNDYFYWASQ